MEILEEYLNEKLEEESEKETIANAGDYVKQLHEIGKGNE